MAEIVDFSRAAKARSTLREPMRICVCPKTLPRQQADGLFYCDACTLPTRDPNCGVCSRAYGATGPVCRACLDRNPLRGINERECRACERRFLSPLSTGNCPRCGSDQVLNVGYHTNSLKRL